MEYDTNRDTRVQWQLGEPKGPRPERRSWREWEIYERLDGTRYRRDTTVHRWGSELSIEPWTYTDPYTAKEA